MTGLSTPGTVRKAVRKKVQDLLMNRTPAGKAVFVSKSLPTDAERLPVIGIYTTGEAVEKFNEAPKDYRRDLSLLIEVNLVGDNDEDLEQKREEFADIIEALVDEDETLGGIVDSLWLTGNEFAEDASGESPVAKLSILYTVRYYLDPVKVTDIDEFQGMDVAWKIKRPEELPTTKDAEDEINVQP